MRTVNAPVLIVATEIPGYQPGFEFAGHVHIIDSFIQYFRSQGRQVVLLALRGTGHLIAAKCTRFDFELVAPGVKRIAGYYVTVRPKNLLRAITAWAFRRLPPFLQSTVVRKLLSLRSGRGYQHVLGQFLTPALQELVRQTVASHDPYIVLYDSIFSSCGVLSPAQYWVITHDVKYKRAQSFASRGYEVYPHGFTADIERLLLEGAGNIIAIQPEEAAAFRDLAPNCRVITVPACFARRPQQPSAQRHHGVCLFVGSGSLHNVDGLDWFLDSAWPLVTAAVPGAELRVCGSVCLRLGKVPAGVKLLGVVPDLSNHYAEASVVIVPLRVGSGLKVKLIEALAAGAPIVSTTVGAEGVDPTDPAAFLVADTAKEFADAVIKVLLSNGLRQELSAEAQLLAQSFTADVAFAEFADAIGALEQ